MKTRDFIFLLISRVVFFLSLLFAAQYPSQLLLAIRFSFKEWHRNVYLALPRLLQDSGLLILYSFCQSMENLRRKTFHFLQLKSMRWSFRERKVCGWGGCSPEACTDCILTCFLRRRSGSGHTFPVQGSDTVCGPGCQHPASAASWCFSAMFPLSKSSPSEKEDLCGFIQVEMLQLGLVLFQVSEKQG